MATLNGQLLRNTFAEVLKLNASRTSPPTGGNGISSSLVAVEDGKGVATPLSLSTTQVSTADLKSLQVATANRHSVRPSLLLDFANGKQLDPRITFTRSHTNSAERATYIDSSGNMRTAAENEPRFDHDPVTLECKGYLAEPGRTNGVRNAQATGSTTGVIGSGGAGPTFWVVIGGADGLTTEIAGSGTENGLNYIDWKISGTPTATAQNVYLYFEQTRTQIAATQNQVWTGSFYAKLSGGSAANTAFKVSVEEGGSSGQFLDNGISYFTPVSGRLIENRIIHRRTLVNASTAGVRHGITLEYTNGNAVNVTLRVAAPQLEQGTTASSYIPTTTAAVARGADVATLTPISSFFNPVEGTIFVDMVYTNVVINAASNIWGTLVSFGTTTSAAPFIDVYAQWQTTGALTSLGNGPLKYQEANSPLAEAAFYGIAGAGTNYRYAVVYKQNDFISYRNGGGTGNDTTGDISAMTQLNRMGIGCLATNTIGAVLNNHIKKIAYYPRRLTNTELQTLSTL